MHDISGEQALGYFVALEEKAQRSLDPPSYHYIAGAAENENTSRRNRDVFAEVELLPRVLNNVGDICLSAELLGHHFPAPIMISPCAFHGLVCEEAEFAMAGAATYTQMPYVVNVMSNHTLEDIKQQCQSLSLLQLNIYKDRDVTKDIVRRAEKAGYSAFVLTVDTPCMGLRYRDSIHGFKLPDNCFAVNFTDYADEANKPVNEYIGDLLDPSLNWDDIAWLKTQTRLPIFLKGITNPLDAKQAVDLELGGIIISNHGGRQHDTTAATLDVLPMIKQVVGDCFPIWLDGGVRSGNDIAKALMLGADGVSLGRPFLWALAAGQQQGVIEAYQHLVHELTVVMRLLGCRTLAHLPENVRQLLSPTCQFAQRMMIMRLVNHLELPFAVC